VTEVVEVTKMATVVATKTTKMSSREAQVRTRLNDADGATRCNVREFRSLCEKGPAACKMTMRRKDTTMTQAAWVAKKTEVLLLLSSKALACIMVRWFQDTSSLPVPVHCLAPPHAATGAKMHR
jgi:hypothetical protein